MSENKGKSRKRAVTKKAKMAENPSIDDNITSKPSLEDTPPKNDENSVPNQETSKPPVETPKNMKKGQTRKRAAKTAKKPNEDILIKLQPEDPEVKENPLEKEPVKKKSKKNAKPKQDEEAPAVEEADTAPKQAKKGGRKAQEKAPKKQTKASPEPTVTSSEPVKSPKKRVKKAEKKTENEQDDEESSTEPEPKAKSKKTVFKKKHKPKKLVSSSSEDLSDEPVEEKQVLDSIVEEPPEVQVSSSVQEKPAKKEAKKPKKNGTPPPEESAEPKKTSKKQTKKVKEQKSDISPDEDFEVSTPAKAAPKPAKRSILQLKITLSHTNPPIWRRIQVLNNDTFYNLNQYIKEAMGWMSPASQLFVVAKKKSNIRLVDASLEGLTYDFTKDKTLLKQQNTPLSKFFNAANDVVLYDFSSDGWIHEIVVEKILPPPGPKAEFPKCTGGQRARPPEDCGGIDGFQHLLDVYKDPKHEEYKELIKDWLAENDPGWTPEKFDKKAIFKRVKVWVQRP